MGSDIEVAESAEKVSSFIERWSPTGGGERSNYQMFLVELCELVGAPKPEPRVEDEKKNAYVFEKTVERKRLEGASTTNFIDLYKRKCFVLEAKQSKKRVQQAANLNQQSLALPEFADGQSGRRSVQWDTLMKNAREQAEGYAKRLPTEEGWPPFLITVDVGHVIELWADFSLQGKHYAQYPDRQNFRIFLDDLKEETVRERLRMIWTDPTALDPARKTAEVTRDIAEFLAKLSKGLETRMMRALPEKQSPEKQTVARRAIAEKVALFLMRSLFTMFAEDVGLLPHDSFSELLRDYKGKADKVHFALERLWKDMNAGNFSPELKEDVLRFNGGLFENADALPITEDELSLLIMAAERDWQNVEPAIFGTLLERALDPGERHKLGAHYTPRAYVERLVVETVIDPLKDEWKDVQAAAAQLVETRKHDKAREEVRKFHRKLCNTKVLDPACGTGNFLYVTMELMKRMEGEVLETLAELGESAYLDALDSHTVDPHQFLGLELNPRAVPIAELVLWIGYLQWHFRTRGRSMPAEPVLKNFANIKEQDAILAYDSWDVLRDDMGRPVTRWDGVTYKLHPITGEEIPDEAARMELRTYLNPRPAKWPSADYVVGNPPFIGGKDMRHELGDGYAEACWKVRKHIPGGADFVMHFWDKAAETVRAGKAKQFGLITTNSITQKFSRKVIERHMSGKKPISLRVAIPDHPWLKSSDKAAVRIAMTTGVAGNQEGLLRKVVREEGLNTDAPQVAFFEQEGKIHADFSIGADVSSCMPLQSNDKLCSPGVKLHGAGFIVTPSEAVTLGLGRAPDLDQYILQYRNGRDLASRPRGVLVIDLYPMDSEEVRQQFPAVYQWIVDRVKPERDHNNRQSYRDKWWIFGEPRKDFRPVLKGISRYIATVETSKHRFFQFLDTSLRPDNMLINFALDDAFFFGVLSSHIHVAWALAAGGRLGVGNDPRYNKTRCFDPFPFPELTDKIKDRIRKLAEQLDQNRKTVLEKHKQLTMTGLYNVLEKVRAGTALSDADKDVYDAGLVGVLRQLHDDLDIAVAEAYGWPADLSDGEILERLVALNHERVAEEAKGKIRWLRPEFQAPKDRKAATGAAQIEADLLVIEPGAKKPKFPTALPDQVAMVRSLLSSLDQSITSKDLSRRFAQGANSEKKVGEVLRTLVMVGYAEEHDGEFNLIQ